MLSLSLWVYCVTWDRCCDRSSMAPLALGYPTSGLFSDYSLSFHPRRMAFHVSLTVWAALCFLKLEAHERTILLSATLLRDGSHPCCSRRNPPLVMWLFSVQFLGVAQFSTLDSFLFPNPNPNPNLTLTQAIVLWSHVGKLRRLLTGTHHLKESLSYQNSQLGLRFVRDVGLSFRRPPTDRSLCSFWSLLPVPRWWLEL